MPIANVTRRGRFLSALVFCTYLAGCDGAVDIDALLAKANTAAAAGDTRTAVIELKNVLQENPEHADARWRLGNIYLELGQGSAAVKELERAQRLGYKDEQLPVLLLRSRMLLGEYKKVIGTLSTMNGVASNGDLLILLGQAQLSL